MNFGELQDQVKFLLNFNDGATDQDFSLTRIKQAINMAYKREVNRAQQHGNRDFFTAYEDHTWSSGESTFTLPASIKKRSGKIVRFEDVSSTGLGTLLDIGTRASDGLVVWRDRETLYWGDSGPSEDKTIRIIFLSDAQDLATDADEPSLIPPAFHELIVWSAAVFLREVADEEAPPSWKRRLEDLQDDFWKALSRGRVFESEDWISLRDTDYRSEGVF